jgi:uncharacterized membrane protein YeiH
MQTLLHILDIFGVAVFAISGALAAGKRRMDLFGVVVLAAVTALGGGTLRDMILDVAVFWVTDPTYLIVAVAAAVATFFTVRLFSLPPMLLAVADALGLAVFTILGTEKALALGMPASIAVVMGVMTGIVGGMIRDVLSGEMPLILRSELYATASLCGAIILTLTISKLQVREIAVVASLIVTLALRLAAIKWKISLPLMSRDKGT